MSALYPRSLDEAIALDGEFRAGGTDVEARRRIGLANPTTIDLRHVPGVTGIERTGAGTTIGALTRVTELARDLEDAYPALAHTAGAVGNPHARAVGTLGGNLLQHTRCWYVRTGDVDCFKTGGEGCPARAGVHDFGNVFDTSSCVAPHPSSLAMALLLYDADVVTHPGGARPVASLYDPIDSSSEHTLPRGVVLTSVLLPPPVPGERGAYRRASARGQAEWPLAEAACRLVFSDSRVELARVAAGGVAPVPLRLTAVESALEGIDAADVASAARHATDGARPAPQAAYKAPILETLVGDVLTAAASGHETHETAVHERPLRWISPGHERGPTR